MDAEQWLATVFTPALGRESLAYSNDADQLRGQLAALHDCGVLDDTAHADARQRLEQAVEAARRRAQFDVRPPGRMQLEPLADPALPRVLAVAQPLAQVDGMPFVLTSVELWTNRVDLYVVAMPTAEAEQHRRAQEAKLDEWAAARREGRSGEATLSPPLPRGHRLLDVNIRLRDDLGTGYHMVSGGAGGTGTDWRVHRHYEPNVPANASLLTIEATDSDGHAVGSLEVPL
ncbi:hypothetical protein Drose_14130 [Dactylosporangium roseum]|uniref:Uncharacterized protein n=1 Tax=Dactylosporangium roseum TaxID=47989 RepID=A0ABY5ZB65_9ACTN|nr:hypothetical protein [Dactylosporangium roseum]UWZ39266.1 hypothetical protein Drose_14130 [Dactylosporangium roseum]